MASSKKPELVQLGERSGESLTSCNRALATTRKCWHELIQTNPTIKAKGIKSVLLSAAKSGIIPEFREFYKNGISVLSFGKLYQARINAMQPHPTQPIRPGKPGPCDPPSPDLPAANGTIICPSPGGTNLAADAVSLLHRGETNKDVGLPGGETNRQSKSPDEPVRNDNLLSLQKKLEKLVPFGDFAADKARKIICRFLRDNPDHQGWIYMMIKSSTANFCEMERAVKPLRSRTKKPAPKVLATDIKPYTQTVIPDAEDKIDKSPDTADASAE